ncbi:MAG: type II secretion system F family protein, partial [Actinomycetospora chiangmaiensis]|nr:type II secretion system F family protein [Actinomycetospora chiangmaiensis]
MNAASFSVALGIVLVGCAAILFGLYARARENPLLKRLGAEAGGAAPTGAAGDGVPGGGTGPHRALRWLLGAAGSRGQSLAGTAQDRRQLRRLLIQAGFRAEESLGLLMLAKYGIGLVFALVVLFGILDAAQRTGPVGLAGGLIALFAGTVLPEAWLRWRAARRGGRLARSVPDGLDLMVICAEAGLPLGRILQVVSRELALAAPELADELRYTFAELQISGDRARALTT